MFDEDYRKIIKGLQPLWMQCLVGYLGFFFKTASAFPYNRYDIFICSSELLPSMTFPQKLQRNLRFFLPAATIYEIFRGLDSKFSYGPMRLAYTCPLLGIVALCLVLRFLFLKVAYV